MTKIAILSCGNFVSKCDCGSKGCLNSFNNTSEMFDRYKNKPHQLVGFSDCAGCPTINDHEKILKKVKPLVEDCMAEKIHFSSCMVDLCPFVQMYIKVINKTYPSVEIIMGTDEYPAQSL